MYAKIIRGSKQIGGNIIEIGTASTRLIFDAGTNLPPVGETDSHDDIHIDGLTQGAPAYSAVFISHHHADHCGLLSRILPQIPVYCGKETSEILRIIADFTHRTVGSFTAFSDKAPVTVGDIKVTPILTSHSAKDAYMFYIEAEGKSVLYSGDFNGFSGTADFLAGRRTDMLITEGTNVNAEARGHSPETKDEHDVAAQAERICREYDGTVFVLCSSANEDRVQAMKAAARNTRRTDYEDLFMAALRRSGDTNKYKFIANYVRENTPQHDYFDSFYRKRELIGAETLAHTDGSKLLFVRQSMSGFIGKYLSSLPHSEQRKRHVLIYSMWKGYAKSAYTRKFLKAVEDMGVEVVYLHCSGHAYADTLKSFVEAVSPDLLVPVHCEEKDRAVFAGIYENCIMPEDGEQLDI